MVKQEKKETRVHVTVGDEVFDRTGGGILGKVQMGKDVQDLSLCIGEVTIGMIPV